jgi:hypothetical protein
MFQYVSIISEDYTLTLINSAGLKKNGMSRVRVNQHLQFSFPKFEVVIVRKLAKVLRNEDANDMTSTAHKECLWKLLRE